MSSFVPKAFILFIFLIVIEITLAPSTVFARDPFANLRPNPVLQQGAIDSNRIYMDLMRQRILNNQRYKQERTLQGQSLQRQLDIEKEKTRQLELQLELKRNNNTGYRGNFQKGMNAANRGDFAGALKEWTPLAQQGHVESMTNIGKLYHHGKGVSQSYDRAARLYNFGVERGNAQAQTLLGGLYAGGKGVPQNYKEAQRLWHLAARQGDNGAQGSIGFAYELGMGVPINYSKAKKWYRIAINNGNKVAPGFLAKLEAKIAGKK